MAKGILPASQLCDYGHIEALWSEIQQVLLADVETHAEITARIKALEEAEGGIQNFSLYWCCSYLYLVHPKTPEKARHREYVGNKPERVKKAVDAAEASKMHKKLRKEKKGIERRANRLVRVLTRFVNVTRGGAMSAASHTPLSSVQENAYRLALHIHTLDALAKTYISQHVAIATQMLDLEQLGVIHAATYFQWGKYLYLIYPMKNGKRKRVYVGSDRAKIAETEAAIERGKEHLVLAQQLHLVEHQLANLAEKLDLFIFNIKETS